MTVFNLRRAVLGLACASAALLAACGASSVESQLVPSRIIGFGDAFSVVTPGVSYTVNDTAINTWIGQLASSYGVKLNTGLVYAQGNARITNPTDAAGGSTPPIKVQIDNFLANNTLGANDLVVINGGISDIVADMAASGTTANATQYGKDLGAQVKRLVDAGGKYVAVVGPYNLGRSPWATAIGKTAALEQASLDFNIALKVYLQTQNLATHVRYIEAEGYFNKVSSDAEFRNFGFTNKTDLACTSVDPAAGIGTGTGQVNSSLCTPSTLNPAIATAGVTYDKYLFADRLYFTPQAQRLFGLQAYIFLHGSNGF